MSVAEPEHRLTGDFTMTSAFFVFSRSRSAPTLTRLLLAPRRTQMHRTNNYLELGKYADRLIRTKARELVLRPGFTGSEQDDIEQELALDLLVRLPKYDPAKARKTTFMARVVEHRIATLIEERNAGCRDWRLRLSPLKNGKEDEEDDGGDILSSFPDPAAATADDIAFKVELDAALDALPEHLRAFWDVLLTTSIPRLSKKTGTPTSTLYERRERLRRALREGGL